MAMLLRKCAAAVSTLGPARVYVVGALALLVLEGVVTPATGFAVCLSSSGLRHKTGLGGNLLMSSVACSYGSAALARRDSASSSSSKGKGRPGWRGEKSPGALGSLRPVLSLLATPVPESGEGLRSEGLPSSFSGGLSPSGPQDREPQELVYGETAARSFVKALVWRLTAAVITLVSGLVFSGSLSTAMSIVGSDFVTKSGFMFAGERLWNKVKWGQGKKGDSTKRSLAKAVLWRVFAASNTLICGVFLARDLSVASKIAGSDTLVKTALFFVNERAWTLVEWGKQYEPEYFI